MACTRCGEVHVGMVHAARAAIAGVAVKTPLIASRCLDGAAKHPVFLKLETLQPVGAFKVRGAANALSRLDAEQRARGVVCCSTGNHGRGVAYAGRRLGVRATVCLSSLVPDVKVRAIEALGATVVRVGRSQDEAQVEADRMVREEGLTDIPPFDHPHVIAGQGTIALEILEDRPDIETILVPLSGGGLIGGIALAAKALKPSIRIIGISMKRGAAMQASLMTGRPVEVEELPTLADSLGGGIGLRNRWTFDLCRNLVDDVVLLDESEIYRGMRVLLLEERLVTEGAAAVGHAALLAGKVKLDGPAAIIVSGQNAPMEQVLAIGRGEPVTLGGLEVKG
jgi:threonine dehydratase